MKNWLKSIFNPMQRNADIACEVWLIRLIAQQQGHAVAKGDLEEFEKCRKDIYRHYDVLQDMGVPVNTLQVTE